MVVDEEYLNELLKYDFISKQRGGKKLSSCLIQKKPRIRKQINKVQMQGNVIFQHVQHQMQQQNQNEDILVQPPGLMNVKLWHDKLTPAQKAAYQRGLNSAKSHNTAGQQSRDNFLSANGGNDESQYQDFDLV